MNVQYELDGAKVRIVQFRVRKSRVKAGLHRMLRQSRRTRAVIERVSDQQIENLSFDPHNYLNAAFAALEATTTNHRFRLGGSIHGAVSRISDGLRPLV